MDTRNGTQVRFMTRAAYMLRSKEGEGRGPSNCAIWLKGFHLQHLQGHRGSAGRGMQRGGLLVVAANCYRELKQQPKLQFSRELAKVKTN